jgi:hypothetical protein
MVDALALVGEAPSGRAVVVEGDRPVGTLSVADLVEAVEERDRRGSWREPPARPAGALVWVVVGLSMLVAAAALYRPPYVLISPGDALDVADDIRITGVPVENISGRYLLATVQVRLWSARGWDPAAWRRRRLRVRLGGGRGGGRPASVSTVEPLGAADGGRSLGEAVLGEFVAVEASIALAKSF